jgi:hypothetical protein
MYSHKWTCALLVTGLFAMQSTASNADDARIGVATSTKPDAERIIGGNPQTLMPGNELYANETVRTGNIGRADLRFLDNTNLTVGPASEVRLDKFVYDPTGSSGAVVINATRGAFRFVTGTQDHRAYRVDTPYGTLGVRGTVVEMKILPNIVRKAAPHTCVATIRLVSGTGTSFTLPNGKKADLTDAGSCACITASGDIQYAAYCPAMFPEVGDPIVPPPPPPPPPPCLSPTSPEGCQ